MIGTRFVAYSLSGEYFLGRGICVAVRKDGLRCTLKTDNGENIDVATRCLRKEPEMH